MNDTSPEIIRRREAVAELGAAVRDVIVAQVEHETPLENLAEATELARRLRDLVAVGPRLLDQVASVDDLPHAVRYYSPVIGLGNPSAPPVTFEDDGENVLARTTLDRRFEGPPGHVHGGVTGMLLDEILGRAGTQSGHWGMTAYLNITYRRALPLDVELVLRSRLDRVDGRKVHIVGSIALASNPGQVFVEAEGLFIEPRAERAEQYFGSLRDLSGNPQSGRHGGFESLKP